MAFFVLNLIRFSVEVISMFQEIFVYHNKIYLINLCAIRHSLVVEAHGYRHLQQVCFFWEKVKEFKTH